MSATQSEPDQNTAPPRDPAPVFLDARREFAERFLAGQGLEIGALHLPLQTPSRAHVRYVDRMSVEDLRAEYAELAEWDLTPVDVIDNGELLTTIPESSQDFIVANHFLEHCEDPIRTIETHLGKLKPGASTVVLNSVEAGVVINCCRASFNSCSTVFRPSCRVAKAAVGLCSPTSSGIRS